MTLKSDFSLTGAGTITPKGSMNTANFGKSSLFVEDDYEQQTSTRLWSVRVNKLFKEGFCWTDSFISLRYIIWNSNKRPSAYLLAHSLNERKGVLNYLEHSVLHITGSTRRVCSLVGSNLRSETKGSRFEPGCYLAMCRRELPAIIAWLMFKCL